VAVPRWRPSAAGVGAAALLVAVVLLLDRLRLWERAYDAPGPEYLLYNLCRIVLAGLLVGVFYAVGARLVPGASPVGFAVTALSGAALCTLGLFALGMLGLYRQWLLLALSAATLLMLPALHPRCWRLPGGRAAPTLLWAALLVGAYLVVGRVLLPDTQTNDPMGHYLPYAREVLERGGLAPNPFFMHFFYTKGATPMFLAAALSDVQGLQLASAAALLLSASLLVWLAIPLSGRRPEAAFVALLLFLASPVSALEFQKPHLLFCGFALLVVASLASWSGRPDQPVPPIVPALGIVAATVVSPVAAVMLPGLVILTRLMLAAARAPAPHFRLVIALAALQPIAMAAILLLNWALTGMLEVTPQTLVYVRDDARVASWVSPAAIEIQWALSTGWGSAPPALVFQMTRRSDLALLGVWVIGILALLVAYRARRLGRPILAEPARAIPLLVGIGTVVLLRHLVIQESLVRLVMAMVWWCAAGSVAFALGVAADTLRSWPRRLAVASLAATALVASALNAGATLREDLATKHLAFAWRGSYREAYGGWVHPACRSVAALVGADAPVQTLNFLPGCWVMPDARFLRPFMNSYNAHLAAVLFGEPGTAESVLRAAGVNHVLVDLDRPFVSQAWAPLFEPTTVEQRFGLAWRSGSTYLLTWRSADTAPVPAEFADGYRRRRAAEDDSQWAAAWRAVAPRAGRWP
jgi:hypothetical protein